MKSARELAKRLEDLAVDKPVFTRAEAAGLPAGEWRAAHWIKPQLLCEVAFTEWTEDGRIRHPSFQGLREDKNVGEVEQEIPQKPPGGLVVAGIAITHPDRVISPTGQVTKGELAEYIAGVADLMLPHIVRHPLSLMALSFGYRRRMFFPAQSGPWPRRGHSHFRLPS